MLRDDIRDKFIEILRGKGFEIKSEDDSIEHIEEYDYIREIVREFDIEIRKTDILRWKKISDIVDFIEDRSEYII